MFCAFNLSDEPRTFELPEGVWQADAEAPFTATIEGNAFYDCYDADIRLKDQSGHVSRITTIRNNLLERQYGKPIHWSDPQGASVRPTRRLQA